MDGIHLQLPIATARGLMLCISQHGDPAKHDYAVTIRRPASFGAHTLRRGVRVSYTPADKLELEFDDECAEYTLQARSNRILTGVFDVTAKQAADIAAAFDIDLPLPRAAA